MRIKLFEDGNEIKNVFKKKNLRKKNRKKESIQC